MKKRVSRILNFVAFNLLFFALYLNFIHKDHNVTPPATPRPTTAQGTVLVDHPEQYIKASKSQVNAGDNKTAYN